MVVRREMLIPDLLGVMSEVGNDGCFSSDVSLGYRDAKPHPGRVVRAPTGQVGLCSDRQPRPRTLGASRTIGDLWQRTPPYLQRMITREAPLEGWDLQ